MQSRLLFLTIFTTLCASSFGQIPVAVATTGICRPGEYPEGGVESPRACSPLQGLSCSFGSTCVYSILRARYHCCASGGTQIDRLSYCGNGVSPFLEPGTGTPRTCSPSASNCPSGYRCTYIAGRLTHHCCGGGFVNGTSILNAGTCPAGMTSVNSNGSPIVCSGSQQCPSGSCVQSPGLVAVSICCSGGGSVVTLGNFGDYCPANFSPQLENGVPKVCNPGQWWGCFQNGAGGCYLSVVRRSYYCCLRGNGQATPAPAQFPVCPSGFTASQSNNQFDACSSSGGCPTNYVCMNSAVGGPGLCCIPGAGVSFCPAGLSPLLESNRPRHCLSNSDCTSGYSCLNRDGIFNSFCCGTAQDCPAGETLYQVNNQRIFCSPQLNNCPAANTICRQSPADARFHCCSTNSGTSYTCPSGRTPFLFNGQPQLCSFNGNICPNGFGCEQCSSPTGSQIFICSQNPSTTPSITSVCPLDWEALLSNGAAVPCRSSSSSDLLGGCPNGYLCNAGNIVPGNTYYCCRQISTYTCPNGRNAIVVNGQVQNCFLGGPCPNGGVCERGLLEGTATNPSVNICCEPEAVQNFCPAGETVNFVNGAAETCNPFASAACSAPYTCTASTSAGNTVVNFYCCTYSAICSGGTPYMVEGVPQQCQDVTGTMTRRCPVGYSCQFSSSNGAFCCSGNDPDSLCPNGQKVFLQNGAAQSCNLASPACPAGFLCTPYAGLQSGASASYCCQAEAVCPGTASALLVSGLPQSCLVDAVNPCPTAGYTCQFTSFLGYFCCSAEDSGCQNQAPYYLPGSNLVQFCTEGLNECPGGFSCQPRILAGRQFGTICCAAFAASPSRQICPDGSPGGQSCNSDSSCSGEQICAKGICCATCEARVRNSSATLVCEANGRFYANKQCGPNGDCWCVTRFGKAIAFSNWKSGARGKNCDAYRKYYVE